MIRSFHLRDAQLVARLQREGMPLDIEEQLTHPRSPLRSVFINTVLSPRLGPTTFILKQKDESGELLGLAQVRTRPGRSERDVVFMSPRLDNGSGSHAIWQRLLTHLCVQCAEQGTLRVYARLPLDSDELQVFKNVGFVEYGHDNIYQLDQNIERVRLESTLKLRPQQLDDGWALQKLYATLTPRSVQTAEGLAQGQWEIARRQWGEQGRRFGYVWENKGELLAALHLRVGKRGHWIRTLLHPDAREQAKSLCLAGIRLTCNKAHLPVYFAHRQYEAGWQNLLPELGFTLISSQMLMVKAMTVRVREKTPSIITSLEHTEGAAS